MEIGDIVANDPAHGKRTQIAHRVGLLLVRHLRAFWLQRPADERGKATGSGLQLSYPEQVLDAIGICLSQSVHHGDRTLHSLTMSFFLNPEPLFGLRLLPGNAPPHFIHQNFATPTRDAVEPSVPELPDHVGNGQSETLAEEHDLGGRETVDVNRVMPLDVAHQLEIPLERNVRIVPALEQNLDAADRFALVDLGADLLEAQDIAFAVLGPAVERAELAVGDADIGVVDVPIDDVGNHLLGVVPPPLGIGELPQLEERCPLIELEIVSELA